MTTESTESNDDEKHPTPDNRPYYEKRRDLPHCPECLDPDCYSYVCDEAECG